MLAVILLGGFFYWQMTSPFMPGAESTEVTTLPSGQNTDDSSINEDLASIDAQIQAVSADNASAGESVNTAAQ